MQNKKGKSDLRLIEKPESCKNCDNKYFFLFQLLCYDCFGATKGIPELLNAEAFVRRLEGENLLIFYWQTRLPVNIDEIVKSRKLKRRILDPTNPDANTEFLFDLGNSILDIYHDNYNKINQEDILTEEQKNDWFNKAILELDNYPDVPNHMKDLVVTTVRKKVDESFQLNNQRAGLFKTSRNNLMDLVRAKVTPEQFKKIEKVIELWIDDNEESIEDISEEDILSAKNGALHNIEKHKQKPNGFCEICNEYYNNGSVKTRLSNALEIIQESVQLYGTTHANEDETINTELMDTFSKKQKKRFENTPQEKIDEFLNDLELENKKIKEEIKRIKDIKKQQLIMKSFEEAKSYIFKQNLYSKSDYENYSKTSDFPKDMHPQPDEFFGAKWKALGNSEPERWSKFLGTDKKLYDFRKDKNAHKRQTTKQILEEIEKRIDHYMLFTPGILTYWFKTMGLFHHRDPGIRAFVKQFIETEKTPEGKRQLQEAISKTIFNLQIGHFPKGVDLTATPLPESAKTYLDRERSEKTNYTKTSLLDKLQAISVKSIFENSREIIPMIKDTKLWNLHIQFILSMIWRQLFDPKRFLTEMEHITNEQKNGNEFHDEVLTRFWAEYNGVKNIKFWKKDYSFKIAGVLKEPMLNQLYTAFKIRILNGFCNFGDPGIGKTNAALIATRIPNVKFVLIIAPNNICKQWEASVNNIYPHSFVSIGKKIFKDWAKGSYDAYYHVINYEKFARDKGKLVDELANYQIDFVVIDEAHHTKIRNERNISKTRMKIELLLDRLRVSNRSLKCLMLSATPVINNIREGKSLLEMVTGTKYPNLKTVGNLGNATELHSEFIPFSVRYVRNYDEITQEGKDKPVYVDAYIPDSLKPEEIRKLSWMEFEQICTKARIPEIVKRLKKKTIIFTDFVGGNDQLGLSILELLKLAVEKAGFSVGFFTGDEIKPGIGGKGGLVDDSNCKIVDGKKIQFNPFVDGDLDVLIASGSLSEGINELQYVCNNMIFNGLVWTYAEFKQIIGRLVREGQFSNTVTINLILANINGYAYDEKIKLNRLETKKILGNCVVDGTLPDMSSLIHTHSRSDFKKLINHILKTADSGIKIPVRESKKND